MPGRTTIKLRNTAASAILALACAVAAPPPVANAQGAGELPDPYRLAALVHTTLLALNNANLTGNYTVLRELAAPNFQRQNSAARLARVFQAWRERAIDISAGVIFDPLLTRPATIDKTGVLQLEGFIPTRPTRLQFNLAFQHDGRNWRLAAISVRPVQSGSGQN